MVVNRLQRKKATTRALIVDTATELFREKGYAATSLQDISEAADIATRTIYLHFESKAAIALSYFDDWLALFEQLMHERPEGEPPDQMLTEVLVAIREGGWQDAAAATPGRPVQHPYPDLIFDGPPEIAGRVFQSWTATQERMTQLFADRMGLAPGAPEARAVAAALFAAWTAALQGVRSEANAARPTPQTAAEIGGAVFRQLMSGFEPR